MDKKLKIQKFLTRIDRENTTLSSVYGNEFLEEREFVSTGKSLTKNEEFDGNGFLFLPNFADVSSLQIAPPPERGMFTYDGDRLTDVKEEAQVNGSLSRYQLPEFKKLQYAIKPKIEQIIGKKILPTYAYDRFYFPGQELKVHLDRDACEISVTINVSTNLNQEWPIWLKKPDEYESDVLIKRGLNCPAITRPGDAVLYKGCERPHWRDPMPSNYNKLQTKWRKLWGKFDDTYYHQIFIHYVLRDGYYSHLANDYVR